MHLPLISSLKVTRPLRRLLANYSLALIMMAIFLGVPTIAWAQAYGGGAYGGSIYNGGSSAPTSTPTASPPPSTTPIVGHDSPTPTEEEASPSATVTITATPHPTGFGEQIKPTEVGQGDSSDRSQTVSQTLTKLLQDLPTPIASLAHNIVKDIKVLSASIVEHPAQTASLAAAGASLAAPIAAPLTEALPYLQWRNLIGIIGLFFRRKRQPWGVVYDSTTKEPLDPVVLTLTDSRGRKIQTISDIYGRYAFAVEPGTYRLSAEKTHYQFPSAMLAGHPADEVYDDLYFGKLITINNATILNANIPMDPLAKDWNQAEKQRLGLRSNRALWGKISLIFFYGGLVWSLWLFIQHKTVVNSLILLLYAVILISQLISRRQTAAGIIRDQHGQPIKSAVIRLHNLALPQVGYPPVVTKQSGQYSFLANQGSYQITAELKGPDNVYHQVAVSSKQTINKRTGLVRPNLTVGQ